MLNFSFNVIFGNHDICYMDYSILDDKQLLNFLQEENEDAFTEIYNRHWKRIYTLALSYLKSPEAAQDIVQDVFIKIWTNKENLFQVKEFKSYVFVIARNLIISRLRNTIFHLSLDPDEQIEEEMLLPEKQLSYKESVNLLHKAIELLPLQQRRAYKLSRNEGMRYEEIAQEMGISRLTVRTHITNALSFIRKYLTDHAVHPIFFISFFLLKK
jgi:RNA polymerase sigma-70 factor (ECF subfamily)